MAISRRMVVKVLLLPFVILLGIELLLQLGALVVSATVRDIPTGWSTENTRVLALGDSNTFGIYLEEDESYPSQLQELWNARHPDAPIEVLNLGYPGTNSFMVANNIGDVIKTLRPDIVLLTVGVNDAFTASEYVEEKSQTVGHIDSWRPLALLRRHSRLYKMIYMANQGGTLADNSGASENDQAVNPDDTPAKKRELLIWSDDVEERMQGVLAFKQANADTSSDSTGLTEAITFGGKEFSMVSGEQNALMFPGQLAPIPSKTELGYHYLNRNIASVQKATEHGGASFYLLNYAASADFYPLANAEIRSYSESKPGTRFIDVADAFTKDCPISKECPDLFLPDFHPTAKGYAKVALLIATAFEEDKMVSR
jgi:lysophospholipase L1-like esterase